MSADTKAQDASTAGSAPAPRRPRPRHEHIRTSDDEMKEFNKSYRAKAQSQYLDPCLAQTKASLKCMDENNYEKRKCTRFFKDYKDCKRLWMDTLREERRLRNLGLEVDHDQAAPPTAASSSSSSSSSSHSASSSSPSSSSPVS